MMFIKEDPHVMSIADQNNNFSNPKYKIWQRNDQQVLRFLNSSLSENVLSNKRWKNMTKEMWEALEIAYSSRDKSRIMNF